MAVTTLTLIIAAGIAPDVLAARNHGKRAPAGGHPLGPRAERMASQRERAL